MLQGSGLLLVVDRGLQGQGVQARLVAPSPLSRRAWAWGREPRSQEQERSLRPGVQQPGQALSPQALRIHQVLGWLQGGSRQGLLWASLWTPSACSHRGLLGWLEWGGQSSRWGMQEALHLWTLAECVLQRSLAVHLCLPACLGLGLLFLQA